MDETIKTKPPADQTPADGDTLNEGLEETFPASDAPATTQPGHGRRDDTAPTT